MNEQRYRDLQERFHERLKSDADILGDLANRLDNGSWDPVIIYRLHHVAHKLAGAAGVFNCGSLGVLAADLETLAETEKDANILAEASRIIAGEIAALLSDAKGKPAAMPRSVSAPMAKR